MKVSYMDDKYIKTSEFIDKVKELGYNIRDFRNTWEISDSEYIFAHISMSNKNRIDIEKPVNDTLFDLIVQYARTPVEEREEEPKYYWVIKNKSYGNVYKHFNYKSIDNAFILDDIDDFAGYKTQFTEKEFYKLEKELDIVGWFKRGERVE